MTGSAEAWLGEAWHAAAPVAILGSTAANDHGLPSGERHPAGLGHLCPFRSDPGGEGFDRIDDRVEQDLLPVPSHRARGRLTMKAAIVIISSELGVTRRHHSAVSSHTA